MNDDEVRSLWAEQTTLPLEIDMERIVKEARAFERGVRRRNVVELGAGAFVAVVFGAYAVWFDHPVTRAGAIGVVIGSGIVASVMLRWGRVAALPAADGATSVFLAGYRDALLRQARLLAWAPAWYVLPLLVPGAVFAVGMHEKLGREGSPAGALWMFAAMGVGVSALNLYVARNLRRQAAAIG